MTCLAAAKQQQQPSNSNYYCLQFTATTTACNLNKSCNLLLAIYSKLYMYKIHKISKGTSLVSNCSILDKPTASEL
jgi:hypothetical protein